MKDFCLFSRKLARYLLLCLALSACLPVGMAGCAEQKEADRTLRIGGLGGKPGSINQIVSNGTISVNLADLVYSPLVRINSRMLPEPALAERWETSPDGLTWTFYLRKGVRFHDGRELTSEDCAFTYNAILDPFTNSPWRDNYSMIKTVCAENSRTFRVTLKEPQASFINLMNFPIHSADAAGAQVGTGPFRFKERTADDRIILERNEDYYEAPKGRNPDAYRDERSTLNAPRSTLINRIIARGFDTFPEYFSAFMKGEIDFALFLSPEQYETVSRDPAFRTYRFPSIYTYILDYNPAHPLFKNEIPTNTVGITHCNAPSSLTVSKVRQAMAQAINIPEIIRKVDGGLGVQSTGPFLPGAWFSNPEVKPLEYNPARAMELLKDVATPLRFTLLVDPRERTTEQIARLVYQDLYKIGVRIDIVSYDHLNQDKELVASAGAAVTSIRVLADLEPSWHSDKQTRQDKLWRYINPEIDALFEETDRTIDKQSRTRLYHQLHRMVYEDQSGLFLYNHPNLAAIRHGFGNTEEFFSAAMPFYTIKDWKTTTNNAAPFGGEPRPNGRE
ncbi:MAG: ABC transporter substrate-binding protein [Planctomycetota bacterium]